MFVRPIGVEPISRIFSRSHCIPLPLETVQMYDNDFTMPYAVAKCPKTGILHCFFTDFSYSCKPYSFALTCTDFLYYIRQTIRELSRNFQVSDYLKFKFQRVIISILMHPSRLLKFPKLK